MDKGFGVQGRLRKAAMWLCAVAAACAVVCCAGCGETAEQVKETLRGGIETEMGQLSNLTTETSTELFTSDFTNELLAAGIDPVTVYGAMFASLSYAVGDIQVDGDTAQVALQVTNKDMTSVMQNYTAMLVNELSTQARPRRPCRARPDGSYEAPVGGTRAVPAEPRDAPCHL